MLARSNRRTQEGPRSKDISTMQNKLGNSPILAKFTVTKDNKNIRCNLKSISAILAVPKRSTDAKSAEPKSIEVNLVEVSSVKNSSKKLHWCLLTTLPCKGEQSAL